MKKLLFLLLLPLSVLGQNTQIDLKLFNQDTNVIVDEQNSIEEGETLRMEVHMAAVGTADYDSLVNYKYLFLDIQYNHNILTPVTDGFAFTGIDAVLDAGPITAKYDFPNTSFSIIQGDLRDSHTKWKNGTATYSAQNAKWSVVRIAVQLSNKSLQDLLDPSTYLTVNSIFDMMFTIKPDSNLDAEQEFRLTLAHIEDTDGVMITNPIYATATDGREYYSVEEAVTYNATLHFNLPETLDPTNFKVTVSNGDTMSETSTSTTYTLDANADVILTDVTLDQVYSVWNLEPIDASYIPDVHTVTDAYRSFQYLTDVGINGTDTTYDNFGLFSADANLNQAFNSADTYGLLAYVLGLDVAGEFCLPQQNDDGTWYHGCTATVLYENFTIAKLGAELDIRKTEPTGTNYWNGDFTPTENLLTFDFAFWHHVDLDQSHSTTFPANITTSAITGKSFNDMTINFSSKPVGDTKLDMVSKIEGGLVKVELTHNGEDIVGLQARIKYDTSKLALKNVVFDTGNTVTNFSKPFEGELLFGGLSTDGKETIKKGKAFTLEFTPIGTVNNVTGLFYFENTDAVKANGDKINLNIQ
jgi:hypothetical protein